MMAGNEGWDSLANSIRGVGQDQFNAQLGLANFITDRPVKMAQAKGFELEAEKKGIELDAIKKKEAFLDSPATVGGVWDLFVPKEATPEQTGKAGVAFNTLTNMFGINMDPNSQDPTQPLMRNGKVLTNRDVSFEAPKYAAALLVTGDPTKQIINDLSSAKQALGASSAGPLLSTQEETALSQDPNKAEAYQGYLNAKNDYDRYQKDPALLSRNYLGQIQQLKGYIQSVGGNTALLDPAEKHHQELITKTEGQRVAEQQFVPVTPSMAKATGLPEGQLLPAASATQIGGDVTRITAANIQAGATKYAADQHLAASLAAVAGNKLAMAQNNFSNQLNVNIPKLAAETYEKTHQKDALGNYIDPEGKPLNPQQIQKEVEGITRKLQVEAWQTAYDTGQLKQLGLTEPGFINKAPAQIRSEFTGEFNKILETVNRLSGSDGGTQTLKSQTPAVLQGIAAKVKTGDPGQIDQARKELLAISTQVSQLIAGKQRQIPDNINKRVRGLDASMFGADLDTSKPGFGLGNVMVP